MGRVVDHDSDRAPATPRGMCLALRHQSPVPARRDEPGQVAANVLPPCGPAKITTRSTDKSSSPTAEVATQRSRRSHRTTSGRATPKSRPPSDLLRPMCAVRTRCRTPRSPSTSSGNSTRYSAVRRSCSSGWSRKDRRAHSHPRRHDRAPRHRGSAMNSVTSRSRTSARGSCHRVPSANSLNTS